MDSCSECVLPELKRFEAFLKTVQKHKNGRLSKVRLVGMRPCILSFTYGGSFCFCWQNYENISVETFPPARNKRVFGFLQRMAGVC